MKVQDPNLAASSIATTPPSSGTARGNAAAPAGDTDRVELSGVAGKVGGALRAEAQTRARVAVLQREFQSGTFSRDAGQTSRALVQETLSASAGEKAAPGKS